MTDPFRVAMITTTFFRNSHAGALGSRFLYGFPTDDGWVEPRVEVASIYIDQIHEEDVGRQIARDFGVPIYESIRGALTLGGDELAVDAVLLIGEHGDYPRTALGQEMLPRRYFFEQICGTIEEAGRAVPVFSDKHFAYRWDDAQWMYERAKELGVPLWAASALPVSWREPAFEHRLGEPIEQAMSIGFHMLERYGFHALESLQCQVERREGGETGVRSVECLSGEAVWRAADEGRWSRELAAAAMGTMKDGSGGLDVVRAADPYVFLIEYNDGLMGAALMLSEDHVEQFAYAQVRGGAIDAFVFNTASGDGHAIFSYLGLNIEDFFLTGRVPNPVERTYLTTGILEAAMRSRHEGGRRVETPHLDIVYEASAPGCRRPTGERPTGASLEPSPMPRAGETAGAASIAVTRNGTTHGRAGSG